MAKLHPRLETKWQALGDGAHRTLFDRMIKASVPFWWHGPTPQNPEIYNNGSLCLLDTGGRVIGVTASESARPADPYPFILLNLVLSCLAAVQAPVIMMSQNRHSAKDRFDAQQDYEVNLRAELQITALHQKLDQARTSDWQVLVVLQQRQLDVLDRIERSLGERDRP